MIMRIGRTKYDIYALDFETHNDAESLKKRETSVWLGGLINELSSKFDESSYFYSVEQLLARLDDMSNPKRKNAQESRKIKNICIYVYNLSFEWSFILPVLLKQGYTFRENIDKDSYKCYNSVTTQSVSSVWNIKLKIAKNGGFIIFKDLAKIFPGGLAKVAESYGLEVQKGTEFEYRKNRLHNHIVTQDEKEYNFDDCKIVMEVLQKLQDDKDFWNASSCSTYSCRKMINFAYGDKMKPYQEFRKGYPETAMEESEFLRNSVAGGITYAPDRWQYKTIDNVLHIDGHQMHPSQAYSQLFPYGEGEYYEGKPSETFSKISCCHIFASYTGVKLHSVIGLIGIDFIEKVELYVWDFEIPTMFKCYENLKIEYIDGYKYHTRFLPWRNYYKENYDKRKIAKATKDKFGEMYYKLLNNSSYGKLLEKGHNIGFENIVDEKGIITSNVFEKDWTEYSMGSKYTYLPVGSCIPAYSRVFLIETALKFGWENIVYFDTDSIFIIDSPDARRILKTLPLADALCNWGIEKDIKKLQVACPKRYKMEYFTPDKYGKIVDVKMAGVNGLDGEVYFDEINILDSTWQVKRAYRCKGGTLIDFQTKSLGIQTKYKKIYERNTKNEMEEQR